MQYEQHRLFNILVIQLEHHFHGIAAQTRYLPLKRHGFPLIFKKLTQLHKSSAFSDVNGINDNIFSYIRSHGDDTYLIALNFGKTEQSGDFVSGYRALGRTGEIVLDTLGSSLKEK
ncbi:hypothetical protein HA402_013564 [Bradysia odoriphaga]|nr:hypothetical protein HA402_013564 [Bradysia odoriphaga]